jgi:hypothetical protein
MYLPWETLALQPGLWYRASTPYTKGSVKNGKNEVFYLLSQ